MLSEFSSEQNEWVKKTGFGDLLQFSIKELPHKLGFQLLQAFDENKCTLNLSCGQIQITEQDVHLVLGLPKGMLHVEYEKDQKTYVVKEISFREQFEKNNIRTADLLQKIKNSPVNDKFKMNFLVMMGNTFIQTVSNVLVDQRFVHFNGDMNRCYAYNWCAYLLESLKVCKKEWMKDPSTKYFCGPLVFLIVSLCHYFSPLQICI